MQRVSHGRKHANLRHMSDVVGPPPAKYAWNCSLAASCCAASCESVDVASWTASPHFRSSACTADTTCTQWP